MAKTVSNDALWEKLLEMDEQLNSLSTDQKLLASSLKQLENTSNYESIKDEIIHEINKQARFLGKHSDVNFGVVNQNIKILNEKIRKWLNIIIRIQKQQKETIEPQKADNSYLNFKFFKVRKSSFVTAVLGLLVFLLTVFCMKQQSDYGLLLNEYYKQGFNLENLNKGIKAGIE